MLAGSVLKTVGLVTLALVTPLGLVVLGVYAYRKYRARQDSIGPEAFNRAFREAEEKRR